MRLTTYSLTLVSALCTPLSLHAGPETTGAGMDLEMLDRNGAPFRSFHLGGYAEGLDAAHPTAADALPSEALRDELGPDAAVTPFTGIDAEATNDLPPLPDIAPLLDDSPDDLLHPAFGR